MTKLTALLSVPAGLSVSVFFAYAFSWVYTNAPGGLTMGSSVLYVSMAVLTLLGVALASAGLHTLTH